MLDYVILGIVLNKPLTGYAIKKEIELGIGNFYKAGYGSLYPALKKLTDKGYLTLTEQTQVDRLKKYYMATELGRAVFLKWLNSPISIATANTSVFVRIFFFGELPEDVRRQRIEEYELEMQRILEDYRKLQKQFADSVNTTRDYFEMSTLYYGLQSMMGMVRWLDHIKEQKPFSEFFSED